MPGPFWKRQPTARALLILVWSGLALGLVGCPQSLGSVDPLSPRADVRITKLATPGGSALAPIVSAPQGTATTTVPVAFPQLGVDVTVFNGVSVSLSEFVVEYMQEDGVTPLQIEPLRGPLALFLQAQLRENGFEATTLTVRLSAVSDRLRSFLAGPDGALGTDDDFRSTVVGLIAVAGTDINGHGFRASARLGITARPQAASDSSL